MINEQSLYAIVATIGRKVAKTRINQGQLEAAVEYALVKDYARPHDLWAECLTIRAEVFLQRVTEYFQTTPRVMTRVTQHLIKALPDRTSGPATPSYSPRYKGRRPIENRYFALLFV